MISATVHCDMPGCETSADAEVHWRPFEMVEHQTGRPWHDARIAAPAGWELRIRIDAGALRGRTALREQLAYYCPQHAGA